MFAVVEDGKITSMPKGSNGIKIGDNQYPASIFTLWSESERNAIGVYTIEIDDTNKKNDQWYTNTNQTIAYDSSANKVKATYGTATAKLHADTLYTSDDKAANNIPTGKDVGDVRLKGLKTILIEQVKEQAQGILSETDWYVTRKSEKSTAIPSAITTHRDAVRTKQAEMETAITNAADTPALETLYTYTTTDGVTSRPLGELPTLE